MLHVFIDTNLFLSLYAFTDDNIEELRKLVELIKAGQLSITVTPTVNQEFYRNRDKKLSESMQQLEKFSMTVGIPRFMDHYPEAKELREALFRAKEIRNSLMEKATAEMVGLELAADELFIEIRDLSKVLAITPEVESAARKRMELGNPPGKPDSLGDRLNWEFLLKHIPSKTDLHVVSKDKDYASPLANNVPNSYLAMEWSIKKSATLHLYSDIRSFTKKHFPDIKISADASKILAIKQLIDSNSFASTHSAIAKIAPLFPAIDKDDAKRLFLALINNPEINLISGDQDVKDLYENLLASFFDVLSESEYESVTLHVPDPIPF